MDKCEHCGSGDYCEYAESLGMKMKCPLRGDYTKCKNGKKRKVREVRENGIL